jgi:hypothetical protein
VLECFFFIVGIQWSQGGGKKSEHTVITLGKKVYMCDLHTKHCVNCSQKHGGGEKRCSKVWQCCVHINTGL